MKKIIFFVIIFHFLPLLFLKKEEKKVSFKKIEVKTVFLKEKKIPKKIKRISKKREIKKVSKKLIDDLEKKIQALSKNESQKPKNFLKIPHLKTKGIKSDDNFQNTLILYLKRKLSLPEEGMVILKFQISKNGIEDIKIILSKSKKNEEYLKNVLPKLTLPCFNQNFKKREISITFLNE